MGGNSVVTESKGMLGALTVVVGLVGVLLTAACTGLWHKSTPSDAMESEPAEPPSMEASIPAQEKPARATGSEGGRTTTEAAAPTQAQNIPGTETDSGSRIATLESAPVKPSAPPPASQAVTPEAEAGKGTGKLTPPLDLDLLKQRLKETSAIGFFTKLALKGQVDELLDKFRAFYQGRSKTSLAQLRQPFDLLIMKVLALLQDSDPVLARDILDSREAIWSVLADPAKFAQL